jgi:xanthine dehydrogenase YagS FAD-binding subunit
MKTITNASARDLKQAIALSQQAQKDGKTAAFAGGGSDLLGMVKERIVTPDVIVHLKTIKGLDRIVANGKGITIGGQTTLDTISHHPVIRKQYAVLAEAAETVATPQIRNVGTIAGNVSQRPWCWYFRNGFPCYKAGGKTCFSITGENQFHAIFGGGPSFIVHPSDTAVALVALGAEFRIAGPSGERSVRAAEFFVLPKANTARENVMAADEILASIHIPAPRAGTKSTYQKVMDREAWTHAVVSAAVVLDMDNDVCKSAHIVLGGVAPVPWHLTQAEELLSGQRITPELAARVGEASVMGASPLAKNGYKLPLTQATVKNAIMGLA